jgi:dihydroxyacetone kinase DhaKLM complex PTS-EIIA-like component DhaM
MNIEETVSEAFPKMEKTAKLFVINDIASAVAHMQGASMLCEDKEEQKRNYIEAAMLGFRIVEALLGKKITPEKEEEARRMVEASYQKVSQFKLSELKQKVEDIRREDRREEEEDGPFRFPF